MALKTHSLSFIIILSLFVASSIVSATSVSATSGDRKVLDIEPINDPDDPKVLEAANFAVVEHNKLAKTDLKFQRVINGTVLILGGRYYTLVISAIDVNASQNYLAAVYVKPWTTLKVLSSFEKIPTLV
ncbi:hypothetical protein DH2020_017194 [Rehmannia glutinosa]|uniref:Cystatin domain-containing protein n=1 Tax=Rehmannia glutinosa TaxID=99300 RepID=A0ABR0WTP3_REHGL